MAISEGSISETPISASAGPPPVVIPSLPFIRVVSLKSIPDSILNGSVTRRGVSPDDVVGADVPIVQPLRAVRPQYPNENILKGKTSRREGRPFVFVATLPPLNIHRNIKPIPIDPNMLRVTSKRFAPPIPPAVLLQHSQDYIQNYRVSDDDFSRYELYLGEDQLPDLQTEPTALSHTLPFSVVVVPPVSGTKTLYAVLRERDEYGVISANQKPEIFTIDSSGMIEFNPPEIPVNLQLFGDEIGKALVFLKYNKAADGLLPADTWEIFASVGVDPDPALDVPVHTSTISNFGEISYLRTVISGFSGGDILHVIGAVLRSSDGKRSVTPAQIITLPVAPSIDGENTNAFGGSVHENR